MTALLDPLRRETALRLAASGRHAEAAPELTACVEAAPGDLTLRVALGSTLAALGSHEASAIQFLKASRLQPGAFEPRSLLATALTQCGKSRQALDVMKQTVAAFPSLASAWQQKGAIERKLDLLVDAEASYARALALKPEDADTLNNLGVVTRAQGRLADAVTYYRRALQFAPAAALIHANLGNVLDDLGDAPAAERHLRQALTIDPSSLDARYNLAAHLIRDQQPEEAIRLLEEVIAHAPERWDAHTNLGVALLASGKPAEAERAYRRALLLKPTVPETMYDLAWIQLLTGRWAEGWQTFEWRWRLPGFTSRRPDTGAREWDGRPLPDETILLYAEQGFGDSIQMIRFAKTVRARCARVVVLCPPPLARLLASCDGVDQVVTDPKSAGPIAAQAALMSLPRILGITPDNIPDAAGYLPAPADHPTHLALPTRMRPRVGIVWAGSPDNKIDRQRTIPAGMFRRLLESFEVDVINLQVGPNSAGYGPSAFSCDGKVADFHDTAVVIAQLDLVIGVDTAVMHLAGAMGKPAWLLLPMMPDYRWLLGRTDTPWYGSLRLFRQRQRGDWNQVLGDVATALTGWLATPR